MQGVLNWAISLSISGFVQDADQKTHQHLISLDKNMCYAAAKWAKWHRLQICKHLQTYANIRLSLCSSQMRSIYYLYLQLWQKAFCQFGIFGDHDTSDAFHIAPQGISGALQQELKDNYPTASSVAMVASQAEQRFAKMIVWQWECIHCAVSYQAPCSLSLMYLRYLYY